MTQLSESRPWNSDTGYVQNPNSQNYLSLLVIPEDAPPNNLETNQKQSFTNNISPATITNNESLAAIFPFKLEETTPVLLFSRATLNTKPITTMYTNAKVDGHSIKLILDSGSAGSIITKQLMDQLGHQVDCTASTRIITANGATKTSIGEIDNFSIEVNGIIVSIKVLVMEATQYQALIGASNQPERMTHTCTSHVWPLHDHQLDSSTYRVQRRKRKTYLGSLLSVLSQRKTQRAAASTFNKIKRKGKEKEKNSIPTPIYLTYMYKTPQSSYHCPKLICVNCDKKLSLMGACCGDNKKYSTNALDVQNKKRNRTMNHAWLVVKLFWTKECETTFLGKKECATNHTPPGDEPSNIWMDVHTIMTKSDPEPVINLLNPEQFYEHYQELAPTREEQKQWLKEINTRLCDHCLIPCDFQYCNEYDLIYNPPPHIIYTIPKKKEPISSCASESESVSNSNLDFDNDDDKNNGSSSVQNGNNNDNNFNSDSNFNSNYKQYITLSDLTKKQELK
ncbi:hypothetical protein G9A89_019388 [Geosiphon pyriformis]|nr:hypothetical protein G9A89_019388 [Geosiphon pyriformis]